MWLCVCSGQGCAFKCVVLVFGCWLCGDGVGEEVVGLYPKHSFKQMSNV